jgi:hypothetical protein
MQLQRFCQFVLLFSASWAGSSMVEQLTLNQRVAGSSPARLTTIALETHILPGHHSIARDSPSAVLIAPKGSLSHKAEVRPRAWNYFCNRRSLLPKGVAALQENVDGV